MIVEIVLLMFAIGLLLGFVGAGGSGFIIAILTTVFGYGIHVVLGTALLAMLLSSISGAVSHYREGNVQRGAGLAAGIAGGAGAWTGSLISVHVPEGNLSWLTATMLILSGLALWLRMSMAARSKSGSIRAPFADGTGFWAAAIGIGLVTGVMSGIFGIGSTPFIQIGLMALLGLSMTRAAGTTMMIIVPIALGGGMGFLGLGLVDLPLLVQVAGSIMLGSYVGAKFTKRAPVRFLKAAMVIVPITGGIILFV
ncbi:sulfite exporter TauE/SafE family protein [Paenibacillus sp. HB172176]|uniref:sulfite exporter TauE/SafE family protein n=1 Tax=Paenibacillus sp. HB172176 TaxID=2493690 RepID=UPI00143A9BE2|nr:sulfite exporter TauE/SafE family protein [Paenibacillus sp. HB172176]